MPSSLVPLRKIGKVRPSVGTEQESHTIHIRTSVHVLGVHSSSGREGDAFPGIAAPADAVQCENICICECCLATRRQRLRYPGSVPVCLDRAHLFTSQSCPPLYTLSACQAHGLLGPVTAQESEFMCTLYSKVNGEPPAGDVADFSRGVRTGRAVSVLMGPLPSPCYRSSKHQISALSRR